MLLLLLPETTNLPLFLLSFSPPRSPSKHQSLQVDKPSTIIQQPYYHQNVHVLLEVVAWKWWTLRQRLMKCKKGKLRHSVLYFFLFWHFLSPSLTGFDLSVYTRAHCPRVHGDVLPSPNVIRRCQLCVCVLYYCADCMLHHYSLRASHRRTPTYISRALSIPPDAADDIKITFSTTPSSGPFFLSNSSSGNRHGNVFLASSSKPYCEFMCEQLARRRRSS